MPTFTPPVVFHTPPFLPATRGMARRLFRHMNPQPYGVYVFKMSDGSYVQSEATPENSDTALAPYPLMPDQGASAPNLVARADFYSIATGFVDQATAVNPYVVTVYYGGRGIPVSSVEAAALTAYTAHGIGYGGNIT